MARRVSLPTADDLFRPTTEETSETEPAAPAVAAVPEPKAKSGPRAVPKAPAKTPRTSSEASTEAPLTVIPSGMVNEPV